MQLTDFQKDCLVRAKDHLNKIPRTETNIIRWNLMPGRVAVVVDLWKQSKLSAEALANALMITKSLLPKFAKGKTSSGEKWPELLALLKPEEAEKNKVKKEKEKSEKVVEDAIFKILLRDQVREIGLRTETIAAEIHLYPSRFVSTVLGRLEKAGRLVKFKSLDKYTSWKVVSKTETKPKTAEEIHEAEMKIVPAISLDSVTSKIEKFELPEMKIADILSAVKNHNVEKIIYRDLKLEDLEAISEQDIILRIPIERVSQFSFPLNDWAKTLSQIFKISPTLVPDFKEYFQTGTFLDMLKALEATKFRMKLNSKQEVIDHFNLILKSAA